MSYITIKNYYGKRIVVEVTEEVYKAWNEMYEAERNLRERERKHCFGCDLENCSEAAIRTFIIEEDPKEETVRLYQAIEKLSPVQKRRIRMYMNGMVPAEIARVEKRSKVTIAESLALAISKLREIMSGE